MTRILVRRSPSHRNRRSAWTWREWMHPGTNVARCHRIDAQQLREMDEALDRLFVRYLTVMDRS